MTVNRLLLPLAALLLLGILGCDRSSETTPAPGPPASVTNPEDLVPEVQVQIVDMRYRTPQRTDAPMSADPIPGIIASARTSLDVALPRLNRQEIVQLLLAAAQRGVQVRVVTERGYFDDPAYRPFYDQLMDPQAGGGNLEVRTDPDGFPRLMNARFLVVDNSRVVTGAYTWESADFDRTIGDVVSITNTNVAAAFTSQFNQMFIEGNFGVDKRVESQQSFLVGGGTALLDVHFGPVDGLREIMTTELGQSRNAHVAVQQFKDLSLANTLGNWIVARSDRRLVLTMNNIAGIGDDDDNIIYNAFHGLTVNPPDDMGQLVLGGLGVITGPVSTALQPFLNFTTMNHKLMFVDHAFSNNVPALITTTANFTDMGFSLNDEVMLILRGRPLVNKYIRGPHTGPGGFPRWSLNWLNSLPSDSLRQPADMKELDALSLMFPYRTNADPNNPQAVGFRAFPQLPTGLIYGEVPNFKRTIRLQEPGSTEFEEVNIDLAFFYSGTSFFGFPLTAGDPIPVPGDDLFVENEFLNPNHRYMMVVPAGDIEITTRVTVDGGFDPRFTPTTRSFHVAPGGIRRVNLNINLSPQVGGS